MLESGHKVDVRLLCSVKQNSYLQTPPGSSSLPRPILPFPRLQPLGDHLHTLLRISKQRLLVRGIASIICL